MTSSSPHPNNNNNNKNNNHGRRRRVKLFLFPPSPHVYNISPFGIKVESFLRLHDIPYDAVYVMKPGPKKMIPYVQCCGGDNGDGGDDDGEGEIIADSNVIIPRLKELYGVDKDIKLTSSQRAIGHAYTRMVEEHTSQIGFHYRYGLHMNKFFEVLDIPNRLFNAHTNQEGKKRSEGWLQVQPGYTMNKTKYRGLSVHTNEELWQFSNDDLRSISDYLGEKRWFFDDGNDDNNAPTTTDCMLFGHLVQLLYIPMDFPQRKFIREECPNLLTFVDRFREEYWPDWEDKCRAVEVDLPPPPPPPLSSSSSSPRGSGRMMIPGALDSPLSLVLVTGLVVAAAAAAAISVARPSNRIK